MDNNNSSSAKTTGIEPRGNILQCWDFLFDYQPPREWNEHENI